MRIKKENRAKALAALYNASRAQGMGLLHYIPASMTEEQATKLLEQQTYFDYVAGRVLKVDLSKDEVDFYLYNRDNGEGAGEKVCFGLGE